MTCLCASKSNTLKRLRRQMKDWEKTFAKHKSDKGLLYRIEKEPSKPVIRKQPNFKMGKRLGHFNKEDTWMANT